MISTHHRCTVNRFNTLTVSDQPHTAKLTDKKSDESFTAMNSVRGAVGGIEKMTHPLATPGEADNLSPYMIDLLGETSAVIFAEKVLQAPRQRFLDSLGIDDTQKKQRMTKLQSDRESNSRFYSHTAPRPLLLNGSHFMEQEPTNPYFFNQKIITPDFRRPQNQQNAIKLDLLQCKFRDDSEIYFNEQPISKLESYNHSVNTYESHRRSDTRTQNRTEYFNEMIEYLIQSGSPGDFIVQNSLEASSDKNMPHFQYIPGNVSLPLFAHAPEHDQRHGADLLNWYLPTVRQSIDLQQACWPQAAAQLQAVCLNLLVQHNISTTPFMRVLDEQQIEIFLLFKKDCSAEWNMAPTDIRNAPGWLESSGVFIANTEKAQEFNALGSEGYYSTHRVTGDKLAAIENAFGIHTFS